MSNTKPKISFAGEVSVNEISITSSTGVFQNITPQISHISIFEDIFSTFITGFVEVVDSVGLAGMLPLSGGEILSLDLNTPSLEDLYRFKGQYYIYKIDDIKKVAERTTTYKLYFISREALIDINYKISKAYQGRISDIAQSILSDSNGLGANKKNIHVEDTKNATKFVANWWTPMQCIQYACEHAVNMNNSPSFVFFENKHGMNFVSLETLYTGPISQRFIIDNYKNSISKSGSVQHDIDADFQRVLRFDDSSTTYNYIDRIQSGFYGSELITYDILTKQYSHIGFNPNFKNYKHLNDLPIATDGGRADIRSILIKGAKYYNNFDGFADTSNNSIVQLRKYLLAQAEGIKFKISVYGRFDYVAGQKVYLDAPNTGSIDVKSEKDIKDPIISGCFLISAIHHSIDRNKHTCTIELIKDSFISTEKK